MQISVLFFLPLIILVSSEEANLSSQPSFLPYSWFDYPTSGCPSYTCKQLSQTLSNGTCAYYNSISDTFYIQKCPETQFCIPNQNDKNYSCVFQKISQPKSYPGEKCAASSDCDPEYSLGCGENFLCEGIKSNGKCTVSEQCNPGLSCQEISGGFGFCKPLISIGNIGCLSDFDCIYNAGCNKISNTNSNLNICVEYGSLQPGVEISVNSCIRNQNLMCSSGTCSNINGGNQYFCTENLESLNEAPARCYNTNVKDCISKTDPKTSYFIQGSCICGYNEDRFGYCSLNPGDKAYIQFRKIEMKWLSSEEVKNCNTKRRFWPHSEMCANSFWNERDISAMKYYYLSMIEFNQIRDINECALEVFLKEYSKSKENYESYDDAEDFTTCILNCILDFGSPESTAFCMASCLL
ncbi:unnamed protein product [Blepharisma stoltei]|uniref:Dickkopf N-terminal cysteine-rich domain-containing protein n=1 Tax=Blepharisma stoltei TaxID=1481888 RepID=A0AAU9IGF1_9CILI|nr:unnamed protein product [Blepharisma stoltei]